MQIDDIITKGGTAIFTIKSDELSRGLRVSKRSPRNSRFLVKAVGAVGYDQVLQVIDDLEDDRIDTSALGESFPYPQIFVLTNHIIVCGQTDIYEYTGSLTKVIGPVASGKLWSVTDFYDFLYLTNGSVAVYRSPTSGTYSTSSTYPVGEAVCDFNGQVLVGGLNE